MKDLSDTVKRPYPAVQPRGEKALSHRRTFHRRQNRIGAFSLGGLQKEIFCGMMNFVQSCFVLPCVATYSKSIRYEGERVSMIFSG
jgi:hypothetical protein